MSDKCRPRLRIEYATTVGECFRCHRAVSIGDIICSRYVDESGLLHRRCASWWEIRP